MSRGEDSEFGVKRLNDALLRPWDLILTTMTAAVSAAIRVATRSDISHAMVYVETDPSSMPRMKAVKRATPIAC